MKYILVFVAAFVTAFGAGNLYQNELRHDSYVKGCYDRMIESYKEEGRIHLPAEEYIFEYQKRYAKAKCEYQYNLSK